MFKQKAIGKLVVPFWPSFSFWPVISRILVQFIAQYKVFTGKGSLEHERKENSLLGSEKFCGNILASRFDFTS